MLEEITADTTDEADAVAAPPLDIRRKHFLLRGSNRLLFVLGADPKHADYVAVCKEVCKCIEMHPCHLRHDHVKDNIGHVYTSECPTMRRQGI